jgi:lipopolysaccharide export system protein LptA
MALLENPPQKDYDEVSGIYPGRYVDRNQMGKLRLVFSYRVIISAFLIGSAFLLLGAFMLEAKQNSPKDSPEEIKIFITADQVEFDPQKGVATYTGNVTVTQNDATLYADYMEVHLIEGGKSIDSIKAHGNIRVVQEDKIITAEEGIYNHRERIVVLTGNPVTRQGKNWITGDKITYFWDQGKALIEGNVKATVAVEEEKKERLKQKKID